MLMVNQLTGFGGGTSFEEIKYVGGTNVGYATSGSTRTVALNSGLTGGIASSASEGDLIIAAYFVPGANAAVCSITDGSVPYSSLFWINHGSSNESKLRVAYKFATASDTSVTFVSDADSRSSAIYSVQVFRGVTRGILDVEFVETVGSDTCVPDPGAITPVTPGSVILCFGAGAHSDEIETFSSSDFDIFATVGSNNTNTEDYDATVGIGIKYWTSGAFNPSAFTFSGTGSVAGYSYACVTLALRPAGGSPAGSYARPIGYPAAGQASSGGVSTYTNVSIGPASTDRIIYIGVATDAAGASINSATIDYGTGAQSMTALTQANVGQVYCRLFYASAPTGTTATIAITYGAAVTAAQNRFVVYSATGASSTPLSEGTNTTTDIGQGNVPIASNITVPQGGQFIAILNGADGLITGKRMEWVNAGLDFFFDAGDFNLSSLQRPVTTSGTLDVYFNGDASSEDGALAWVILNPA